MTDLVASRVVGLRLIPKKSQNAGDQLLIQSAPGILFTLFAGPMTDRFGRKPLIICALLGYLLLDIIFLINSYWFYELKVPNNRGAQSNYF